MDIQTYHLTRSNCCIQVLRAVNIVIFIRRLFSELWVDYVAHEILLGAIQVTINPKVLREWSPSRCILRHLALLSKNLT